MMKKYTTSLQNAVLFLLLLSIVAAPALYADTLAINTGKIPEQQEYTVSMQTKESEPGYILAPVAESQTVDLIDEHGVVHHRWPVHAVRARLTKECTLLAVHDTDLKTKQEKHLEKVYREYAWDGKILKEYRDKDKIHHDVNQLPNGHVVFPVMEHLKVSVASDEDKRRVRSDRIIELDKTGNVHWEWKLHDYFPLDGCGRRSCRKPLEHKQWKRSERDWSHVNTVSPLPENLHFEKGDTRFRPGNLLVLPRNFWMFFIVDRKTGEIVWEYTGRGSLDLMAPHEANMIPKGFPGEGNIIVFDNGTSKKRAYSIVQEINPLTKEVVWEYKDPSFFFSQAKGSAQRLLNGNTFISSGTQNIFFEVSPHREVVWKLETKKPLNRARKYQSNHCEALSLLHKARMSSTHE